MEKTPESFHVLAQRNVLTPCCIQGKEAQSQLAPLVKEHINMAATLSCDWAWLAASKCETVLEASKSHMPGLWF